MSISYKRKRFYQEYLIDSNGTQAAIRAGYAMNSAGQQANQMMKDAEGLEYYFGLMKDLEHDLHMSAADVKNEIGKLASGNPRGIFNDDGTIKPPHELDDATAACISSIKIKKDPFLGDTYEYKFHSKTAALENLTKQHNLYEENQKAGAGEMHIHLDEKDSKA